MSTSPLVSFIIPVFNREAYLPELIASIQAQSYDAWEAVFVDDGSTDSSLKLLHQAANQDHRIRVFRRPSNRLAGGNTARNYGFELSKGLYVNFLDSDDYLHADFLKTKMAAFNVSTDGVVSQTYLVQAGVEEHQIEQRTQASLYSLDYFVQLKFKLLVWDVLWRKSYLANLPQPLFTEALRKGQDVDFHLRALLPNPTLAFIHQPLYYYRLTSNSITRKQSDEMTVTVLDNQLDWIQQGLLLRLSPESVACYFDRILGQLSLLKGNGIYFARTATVLWDYRYNTNNQTKLALRWVKELLGFLKRTILNR